MIYRLNDIQAEGYTGSEELLKIKLKWISDSVVYMTGLEENKAGIDSITWETIYRAKNKEEFTFISKAAYIDTLSYRYEGKLVKISNTVNDSILQLLQK